MKAVLNFNIRTLGVFLLFPITIHGFLLSNPRTTPAVTKDYSFREQSDLSSQTTTKRKVSIPTALAQTQEEIANEFRDSGISEKRIVTIERSIYLPFAPEIAYDVYADLPSQPKWSSWLHKVEFTDSSNNESLWTLKFLGFKYSWSAISLKNERPHVMEWKSTSGLANFGRVVFNSKDEKTTTMSLSMTLVAPRAVAALFRKSKRLQEFIEEKMVATSLNSFRDVVLAEDAVIANETAKS